MVRQLIVAPLHFFEGESMKIRLNHDVFNITNRLKQINEGYFVVFNTLNDKYEVHNEKYKNSYCLTLPFSALDSRAIDYVRRSENVEEVLEEIESNNSKLEMQNKKIIEDRSKYQLKEIYDYANKKCVDFDGNAYKFNWC